MADNTHEFSLFSPLTVRNLIFKNRIAVSPMCQYSSHDGFANDWHLVHLGSRAIGGAALVLTEATAISPEGRISPNDLGIWKDEHIESLRRVSQFIKNHQAIPGIQLAHAGRKASCAPPWQGGKPLSKEQGGWQCIAPSSLSFADHYPTPHAMSIAEIKTTIEQFVNAAQRAVQAGFQVIEIHSAHGYLLHEFLSPLSNQRNDEYGGSFDNRIRLLCEVIQAIKNSVMDTLIFVRLSCSDWVADGWTIEDTVTLCKQLKHLGVDLIDASSGGNVMHAKIPSHPGYQVPFAEQIKQQADIACGAVGLITNAKQANDIIANRRADLVLVGREFLRNPYWSLHAAHQLQQEIQWPAQYLRAAYEKHS